MIILIVSLTSNDLKRYQFISKADSTITHTRNKKIKLKGGSTHEINGENLDENLQNSKIRYGLHYIPTVFLNLNRITNAISF